MQFDETLYEILLNTDINDLQSFCQSNNKINKLCYTKHFIEEKFNMLPFNIYRPIQHTFNNLLYINYLAHVAYKLIKFMMNEQDIVFYNNPNANINDLNIVSPVIVDRILNQVNQLVEVNEKGRFYGEFEGSIFLEYNSKTIAGEPIPTNDQKFYLNYCIYTPQAVDEAIGLSINQTIEYLVNVFLNNKKYSLYVGKSVTRFNTVEELEYFIDMRFIKVAPKRSVLPNYKKWM